MDRRARTRPLADWGCHVAWPLAVAFGVYWGHATVGAFRPDYLPEPRYAALRDSGAGISPVYGAPSELSVSDCGGDCSDFDLGYRWASASDAGAAGECRDASWSFRRGCLAYLRADGHIQPAPEPAEYTIPGLYDAPAYAEVHGSRQRDADLQPFEGEVLTLAAANPIITEHGSLPPAHSASSPEVQGLGQSDALAAEAASAPRIAVAPTPSANSTY